MDDILPKLLVFPPHPTPQTPISDAQYDNDIKAQINTVAKINERHFLTPTSGGEDVLDVINPALNSIPYLYILNANCNALSKGNKAVDLEILCDKIENFLETFDGRQIRYAGKELSSLIGSLALIARQNHQPARAIPGVVNAILRLDPTGSMLTSNHILLVQLALESRVFATALPVLDKFILYFPGATVVPAPKFICDLDLPPTAYITPANSLTAKFKYQDVLEYFLWSGAIYIGLRQWGSALECLESAITYPIKEIGSTSKIMTDAYKKWVLVGVLLEGKLLPLPKATSSAAAKVFHTIGKPYESFANVFETATVARLKSEYELVKNIFRDDCNLGLAQQVLAAYQKFQIRHLGNIYSKISIPEIVSQTQSAETGSKLQSPLVAEQLVQSMIQDGILHATLSRPPNDSAILTFSPKGPILSEAQMKRELLASTERIQTLTREIKNTDHMLTYEKEYIKYAQKQKKIKPTNSTGDLDMDWHDDEQLMSDMF